MAASSCLIALACGSSDGDGSGGGPAPIAVTEETFAEALISALCSGGAQCCAQEGKQYDELVCVTTAALFVGFAPVTQAQAKSLGMVWDQAAAEACVNNLRTASQSCGAVEWDDAPCDLIYSPNVEPGGACEIDTQCIPPANGRAECYWPVDGDRQCIQIQFVVQGAACGMLGTECDPAANLYCDYGTETCTPRKALGQACGSSEECSEELRCEGQACAVRAATGEACSNSDDCADGNCSSGVCQAPVNAICL